MKSDLVLLPLSAAAFCVACEVMSNATGTDCPACGSPSLFSLSAVMNREVEPEVVAALEYCQA